MGTGTNEKEKGILTGLCIIWPLLKTKARKRCESKENQMTNTSKKISMSEKLRRMSARGRTGSRERYFVSDVVRWLGTDEKHLRSLVGTLNCREALGVSYEGRAVCFGSF
jgi:hypothetical protein